MKIDLKQIEGVETPFYYYDMRLLDDTLAEINKCVNGKPVKVHYAVKANGNPEILRSVADAGFGADCVSGGEIETAIKAGFDPQLISYAGVGKTDREIRQALEVGIGCFNVESIEELEVIASIATDMGKTAPVALRVNPDIDAHTHHYITTGLEENKFGIDMRLLDRAVNYAMEQPSVDLVGLHFHIGSQITTMDPYVVLCERINGLVSKYREQGIEFRVLNIGGGLGVDYDDPDANPIPDFKSYFNVLLDNLQLAPGQEMHCEPGRSVVCQSGSLIARVTYVKQGVNRQFIILDAGMNDLVRPALYGAHHKIENLTAADYGDMQEYDVVGPVCESSDTFAKDEELPRTRRGDLIALRSAGAYGESMASCYNGRPLPGSFYAL